MGLMNEREARNGRCAGGRDGLGPGDREMGKVRNERGEVNRQTRGQWDSRKGKESCRLQGVRIGW